MNLRISKIAVKNFKGIKSLGIDLTDNAVISGQNASGKTSIMDAVSWLLFDKDSAGNSKFEVRPLDAEGNKVHQIDISVEGTFEADGKTYVLSKTQKENWVKKRGTENPVLQGNKNEFSVNGYPKSDKDYKAFVSALVDEDIFKLLTNPLAFPSLDWKLQRSILMSIVADIDNAEIGKDVPGFHLIAPELEVASLDDIKKKHTKERNELRKRQEEIPVRIDALFEQKQEVDEKGINAEKDRLKAEIEEEKAKLPESSDKTLAEINTKINALNNALYALKVKASEAQNKKYAELNATIDALYEEWRRACTEAADKKREMDKAKDTVETLNRSIKNLQTNYRTVSAEEFDETQLVCKTCGQKLPKTRIESFRKQFVKNKADALSLIEADGKNMSEKRNVENERYEALQAELAELDKVVSAKREAYEEADSKRKAIPDEPVDYKNTPEYKEISGKYLHLKQEQAHAKDHDMERAEGLARINEKESQIDILDFQLFQLEVNAKLDAKIEELRSELKETAQMVANHEQILSVLDSYIRALSKKINDQFEGLEFKLFEDQLNGGVKETCSITYGGVPYSDLNTGHRIVAGCQIIRELQKIYGASVPVWIDNAEGLSEGNEPEMPCQIIMLKVTNDPVITVH